MRRKGNTLKDKRMLEIDVEEEKERKGEAGCSTDNVISLLSSVMISLETKYIML